MRVSGTVREVSSARPLDNVTLTLSIAGEEMATLFSDPQGRYEYSQEGEYTGESLVLKAEKEGYKSREAVHENIAEEEITLDVEMAPVGNGIPWKLIAIGGGGGLVVLAGLGLLLYWLLGARVSDPQFRLTSGRDQKTVEIVSDPGAAIRYTTDASDPGRTRGTVYTEPLVVSESTTVKAVAYKFLRRASQVTSSEIKLQVARPAISPRAGTYENDVQISISCSTEGAQIAYEILPPGTAVRGERPGTRGDSFALRESGVVAARATRTGWDASDVASSAYTLKVARPTFGSSWQATTTTRGASIRYEIDGRTVTESAITGRIPLSIARPFILTAIGSRRGYEDSDPATKRFGPVVIDPRLPLEPQQPLEPVPIDPRLPIEPGPVAPPGTGPSPAPPIRMLDAPIPQPR